MPRDSNRALKRRTEELLFECARTGAGLRRGTILKELGRGVDFAYLSGLARDHNVSSLVRSALKFYTPSSEAGKRALKGLQVSCLAASAQNSFYKEELIMILGSFARKGIPVIPLKGVILSEYLYGDMVSRDQSADVDLLVRESDTSKARALLEELGYAFKPVDEIEAYMWSHSFIKPGMLTIDLHWDITMMVRSRERIDGLWRCARAAGSSGVGYYYFAPEELLLYLSAHLVNSGAFRQLRHVRDIGRLIEKYGNEIDWNSVVRKAREWRLSGSLYAALALIERSSGFIFPRQILREAGISAPKRFLIRLFADKKVVIGGGLRRRLLDAFLSYTFFEIVEARSFKDYTNILKRVFFPPAEIVGRGGYGLRILRGAIKLMKQTIRPTQ